MDSSNGFGSLSMSSDTKPDISQLTISTSMATSSGPFSSVLGLPPGSRYLTSNVAHEYTSSGGSMFSAQPPPSAANQAPFFDIGMLGMSHSPSMQSPSLHSQSSMSPIHLPTSPESSGGLSSGFVANQSPTSTMGPPFHPNQGGLQSMGGSQGSLSSSTKHICAICGDRASGKHYGVYRWAAVEHDYTVRTAHARGTRRASVKIHLFK